MTMAEFVDITADIEKFYGKEINPYERNIWFEELGKIKAETYKAIVRQCFRTEKYMPKLADILKIKTEMRIEKQDWIPIECEACNSTGMLTYHTKNLENNLSYLFVCKCNCENGKRLGRSIPTVSEINIIQGRK